MQSRKSVFGRFARCGFIGVSDLRDSKTAAPCGAAAYEEDGSANVDY